MLLFKSDPMKTVREAKISASFKACLLLHKNGQLSENLLPITRQECVAQVSNELFQHWRNYNKEGWYIPHQHHRRLVSLFSLSWNRVDSLYWETQLLSAVILSVIPTSSNFFTRKISNFTSFS